MLKKAIFIATLSVHSFAAHAIRLHVFSEHSLSSNHPYLKEEGISPALSWQTLIPKGVSVNGYLTKRILLEGGAFFPHHWKVSSTNTFDAISTTIGIGIFDVQAKIITPMPKSMPKVLARTKIYVKTGPWFAHAKKSVNPIDVEEPEKNTLTAKPNNHDLNVFGLTIGAGFIRPLPFWPKIPFDASLTYYYPMAARSRSSAEQPALSSPLTGFASIKVGFMWPR